MCDNYLGVVPTKGESLIGFTIKVKWLRENMFPPLEKPFKEQLHEHWSAYTPVLTEVVLMLDKSHN